MAVVGSAKLVFAALWKRKNAFGLHALLRIHNLPTRRVR